MSAWRVILQWWALPQRLAALEHRILLLEAAQRGPVSIRMAPGAVDWARGKLARIQPSGGPCT